MVVLGLILGGIILCFVLASIWLYVDYQKFKKKNVLTVLLLLSVPLSIYGQYGEDGRYMVSFVDGVNNGKGLERTVHDLRFNFTPGIYSWGITVSDKSGGSVSVDWKNAQFIVNGRASGVMLDTTSPLLADGKSGGTNSLSMSISPAILYANGSPGKILSIDNSSAGDRKSVLIVLPVSRDGGLKQYHNFSFIIKERKRSAGAFSQ
ncbi:hypothetical protein [Bacteroides sp.]